MAIQRDAKGCARLEADGCDLLTLRDGKIAVKKAFRKERALLRAEKGLTCSEHQQR